MSSTRPFASWRTLIAVIVLALAAAACSADDSSDTAAQADAQDATRTLTLGAIPDQEPERLQRTYDLLADYLESEIDSLVVEYVPVTEYSAAVTGFAVGELDAVWFGALTGVQARLEVDGANAIVQRDIDETFTSVFIARADRGIEPVETVAELGSLAGRSLTFGSESSTSGRLMPQAFLSEAGVDVSTDLNGPPGFAGNHDAAIEVVAAGSFDVGALSSEVWDSRVAEGEVDPAEVIELFRTPTYANYHWVAQPDLDERLGDGFTAEFVDALTALDSADEDEAAILELFSAEQFIETTNDNYALIESVGREIGLIRE